jgi:hypothetical protein
MQARGNLAAADVSEVSKVVAGYLPKLSYRTLVVNVQDSLLASVYH